ncbi:toll/interleukin-1 receptor domain-containing protein [Pyxidicoccus sp. 3LFB2]
MERTEPAGGVPLRMFLSYSHKDEALKDELETHLKGLERRGLISRPWSDRRIEPGSEWAAEIDKGLSEADLILLLISPDFVASDYCYTKEMGAALVRHKERKAKVIPVILRLVDGWTSLPFAHIQGVPRDGKPVVSWASRDEAWVSVVSGIRRVCESQRTQSPGV